MYLFSRTARLGEGNPQKQLDWALRITEKVNQISEVPVQLWTTVFSATSGRLVWTATVENLLELETVESKLLADSGYVTLVEEGGAHSSGDPIDDNLLQFVHADPRSAEIDARYATTVQATMAPGGLVRGIELGVETAQRAAEITGCPTSFCLGATGIYGSVEWITVYASIDELQRGQEALAADSSFSEKVDQELSKVYLPGVAVQTAFRKIA
jgi:hypothetical protein